MRFYTNKKINLNHKIKTIMDEEYIEKIKALEQRVSELEAGSKGTKKPKKERKPREPSKYNQFVKEASPRIKAAHPELKSTEIMKLIAKEWRENKANVVVPETEQ